MTKAATPCFTPRIPSASLSTITTHRDTVVGLRASDLDILKIKIHSTAAVRSNFVETRIYLQVVCDTPIVRIILWYHACSTRSWRSARLSVAT